MYRLEIEERIFAPAWMTFLSSTLAVVVSLGIALVMFVFVGVNPLEAFYYVFLGSFGSIRSLTEVLVIFAPLSLATFCMVISLKANFFNIGAEGQIMAGAIAATGVGLTLGDSVGSAAILLVVLGSFLGGAGLSLLCAILKAKFQANEVITTLMMNYVMTLLISYLLHGPWRDPSGWPYSPLLSKSAQFPILLPDTRFHSGILLAIMGAFFVYLLMQRTVLGYKIKVSGLNPRAAYSHGVNVLRTYIIAAIIAGGLAGWAGATEVAGVQHRLVTGISGGYGYTAIMVALVGRLNPVGAVAAALFLVFWKEGWK